jgi:hypothetical protein
VNGKNYFTWTIWVRASVCQVCIAAAVLLEALFVKD